MSRESIPPRPTGSDRFTRLMQAMWDKLWGRASQFVDTDTVKWNRTQAGVSATSSASGGGGTPLIQCVVTQLYGTPNSNFDYIGVSKFDLSTMTVVGDQFNCAKCYTARQPDSESIDGETINYSDYNIGILPVNSPDNVRMANFSDINSEYQVVSPRYLVYQDDFDGDISQYLITVSTIQNDVGMTDGDGDDINYLETSPFRRWAYSPYLNGGND